MIGVVLAALAVLGVSNVVFVRQLARERRESQRAAQRAEAERARLIDQMCNLAGKPWSPPPAEMIEPAPERELEPDEDLAVW